MVEPVADMVNLPTLDEHAMVENIRLRFEAGEVYTTCGRIVVSVNPFRWLPIYEEERVVRYHKSEDPFATEGPHVYSITHAALDEIAAYFVQLTTLCGNLRTHQLRSFAKSTTRKSGGDIIARLLQRA